MFSLTQLLCLSALRTQQHQIIEVHWKLGNVVLCFYFFPGYSLTRLLFPMDDFQQTRVLFPSIMDLVWYSRIQTDRHLIIYGITWASLIPSNQQVL